ncbi:hypothetical protein BP5796_09577 [Coleophoma crateriformis]|uniref:Uncharacterized protein n=1 Tax=Coleophoma crateriformis TaxID=565419 RepID=A0A3D8QYS1_9HELO|nr:hypothetical protein BP5796_09577 [Coleophoma crateriformis]
MRLLNSRTLEFKEFFREDSTPKYAILSHTWEDDEVTFKEMRKYRVIAESKAGFKKIAMCAKQALQDDLDYFWVDTCCIDKSSSAELSEAINSMFRWYRNAEVCYAYLCDVLIAAPKRDTSLAWMRVGPSEFIQPQEQIESQSTGESIDEMLVKARWFTRGWTLQELIAPRNLVFYSHGWDLIGMKNEPHLAMLIEKCTCVPSLVLLSGDFSCHSLAQRMSWAASRSTTRVEDMAYCLMGLFEIHMPMLYGEGERAFIRLQEEIIKQSDDKSIFAWTNPKSSFSTYRGLLARSPSEFAQCQDIVWDREGGGPSPVLEITSKEVKLNIALRHTNVRNEFLALLPGVGYQGGRLCVGIYLQEISQCQFVRVDANRIGYKRIDLVPFSHLDTVFVRHKPILTMNSFYRADGILLSRSPRMWTNCDILPRESWNSKTNFFSFQDRQEANLLAQFSFQLVFGANLTITVDASKNWEECVSISEYWEVRSTNNTPDGRWLFSCTSPDQLMVTVELAPALIGDWAMLRLRLDNPDLILKSLETIL